jgi:GntR family transcriptional regulator
MIDRGSPLPLWAQILDDLRAELSAGAFAGRFPTDIELVARYGVSRQTVREAVRRLSDAGLVERTRGRGTTVREFQQIGGSLESLHERIEAQGASQRSVVRVADLRADPDVARRLELPADARLVHIERLRLADDEPLAIDRAWLPADLGDGLLSADLSHSGIYLELLRSCGVEVDHGAEQIRPVLPPPEDRRALDMPVGVAAFSIERLTCSAERPVEWRHSVVRGDRYTITLALTRSREDGPQVPWTAID